VRPFTSTITLSEALSILRGEAVPVVRTERLPLHSAAGRVLAQQLRATDDVPPFDRAAMDGYAVRAGETATASEKTPVRLRSIGGVFTGEVSASVVHAGECLTIATGAPLPEGADAVVMVEQTHRDRDDVFVRSPVSSGQHVGRRGSDIAAGDSVIDDGMVLHPARIGAVAALGIAAVDVYVRPRVFVASTGNELVAPGTALTPGRIFDINRFTLPVVVEAHGGEALVGRTAGDTVDSLNATLNAAIAADADLIVLSGGSSVGDRDLLIDAVRHRGEMLFHGIAVRPGKPTLLARIGSVLLLGMPGNPTSCLSNAYLLLVPLLRRIARLPEWRPERREVALARDVRNASGRLSFFTVRLEREGAMPAFKGSGDITSLAHADGYIEIPADVTHLAAGTVVTVTLF
jgi:molybdenum cofactor synthesis domain-containing protein